jgi:hypothetical protein
VRRLRRAERREESAHQLGAARIGVGARSLTSRDVAELARHRQVDLHRQAGLQGGEPEEHVLYVRRAAAVAPGRQPGVDDRTDRPAQLALGPRPPVGHRCGHRGGDLVEASAERHPGIGQLVPERRDGLLRPVSPVGDVQGPAEQG